MDELRMLQVSMGFTNEYKYYLLMVGLFGPQKNPCNQDLWSQRENLFEQLVKADGPVGIKRFLQAVTLFFIVKYPEMKRFAPTFMKLLYEQEMLPEDFIINWFNKKAKLDKKGALYNRKCEKAFR